ncbi:hypothetical protein [uncultured Tateyamaria sp.]|uniref:hypothetical protein n=1 Tax=uncultured Tateyamaria sp. TaxID=455651 RepID=UPI0026259743|nr:hypothetical protein [uncultured Tateyamaria sp.]
MFKTIKNSFLVICVLAFMLAALLALTPNRALLQIPTNFETEGNSEKLHSLLERHDFDVSVRKGGDWVALGTHTQWPWLGMSFHGHVEKLQCAADDCLVFGADGTKDRFGGILSDRFHILWSERDGKVIDLVAEHSRLFFPK